MIYYNQILFKDKRNFVEVRTPPQLNLDELPEEDFEKPVAVPPAGASAPASGSSDPSHWKQIIIGIAVIAAGVIFGVWFFMGADKSMPPAGNPADDAELDPAAVKLAYQQMLDRLTEKHFVSVIMAIEQYKNENQTYAGFVFDKPLVRDDPKYCITKTILDISSDGGKYVIHQPLCAEPQRSLCYDSVTQAIIPVDTSYVTARLSCQG